MSAWSRSALVSGAVAAGFDIIVSLDRGMPRQQNRPLHGIALVLIPDNDLDPIWPYADRVLDAVAAATPGAALRVERPE